MKTTTWLTSLILLTLISCSALAIPMLDKDFSSGEIDSKSQPEFVYYKSAQKKYAAGDLKGARIDYEKSLQANPIFYLSMIGLADIAEREGNKHKAKTYFDKAFKVANDSALVHAAYGKYLFKQNDVDGAQKEFEKALELNPEQPDAHAELAVLYLSRYNKPQKAIEHYQKAIKGNPKNISLVYGLSTAQAAAGDTNAAISTLKTVVQKLPDNALPWQYMGVYYSRAGQFDDAIAAFKTSIKKDPKNVESRWMLGDTYVQAKQYKNALNEYQWFADNSKQKDVAYLKQGLVYQTTNDYENARTTYLKATKANPKLPDAYNNLAYITIETKSNYKKGLDWAQKAVELQPKNSIFLDTLGWLNYLVGDNQNAKRHLLKAVESKPVSAEANYHLGKVYEKLNDNRNAEKYFAEAKRIDKNYRTSEN